MFFLSILLIVTTTIRIRQWNVVDEAALCLEMLLLIFCLGHVIDP